MATHFFLPFPQGQRFIEFGKIALLTAEAVYPTLVGEDPEGEPEGRDYSRAFTRIEHESALSRAEQAGEVIPLNPLTYVPDSFSIGEHGQSRLVPVEQFVRFARSLGIDVLPASDSPQQEAGIKYGPMMTIEDIAAALAEQHGIPSEAVIDSLMAAAREIGIRDPRAGLKYTPKDVRRYWDVLAVADVNRWLEGQGVAYRLQLPEAPSAASNAPEDTCAAGDVLATKDQLIEAFGIRTPHQQGLFEVAKGRLSWLDTAKKVPGKSGRGGWPARFDPYLFMVGYLGSTYSQGLTDHQAWAALEKHFNDAYIQRESFDPRKP